MTLFVEVIVQKKSGTVVNHKWEILEELVGIDVGDGRQRLPRGPRVGVGARNEAPRYAHTQGRQIK